MPIPFFAASRWFVHWLLILATLSLLGGACVPSLPPPANSRSSDRLPEMPSAATSTISPLAQTPTAPITSEEASPTAANTFSLPTVTSPLHLSGQFVFEHGNLYIVDASCAQREGACDRESIRLTNVPAGLAITPGNLTASPGGSKIAFVYRKPDMVTVKGVVQESENEDIYVLDVAECMAIQGGCPPELFVRLTTDPGVDDSPVWSPRGDRIIFIRLSPQPHGLGDARLYEMKPNGSHQQLLMSTAQQRGLSPYHVSWSPDGTHLVVSAFEDTGPIAIYVLRLSDFQWQEIFPLASELELEVERPLWAPDGDKIVFEGMPIFSLYGYIINPDGTGLTRLPLDNGPSMFAWSSDGNKLIYSGSCKPLGVCLFLANADGSEPQQLTKMFGPSATLWLP